MKWSTRILTTMLVAAIAGLLASNIILKKEYNKVDKNDTYWAYGKVLEQHFKYIKIDGGNITNIAFEQSPNCSVRVLHDWQRIRPNPIETSVKNDTLYIKFTYIPTDEGEKNWMKWLTLVRVFSPELLSVEGFNTNFEMYKLKQKNITVNMSGKSKFEVESFIRDLDSVNVSQKDSSEVVFEMSPEYKSPQITTSNSKVLVTETKPGAITFTSSSQQEIKSKEAMTIESLNANMQGYTLLDVGHAQIQSLKLNITDSSAIILSGGGLRKLCKENF